MEKKRLIKDQEGFTLIEIIAVLVILGILAAVAVPKFFDLQTKAREKAVQGAVAELTSRVNQYFAQQLLSGNTNTVGNIKYTASNVGTNLGKDFTVQDWEWAPGSTNITWTIQYQSVTPSYKSSDTGFAPIKVPTSS